MVARIGGRREAERQHTEDRAEQRASGKKNWFSMRLDLGPDPMKVHLQRPKEPYADYKDPTQKFWWKRGAKHYIPKVKKFVECTYSDCLVCAYRDPKAFGLDNVAPERMLDKCPPKGFYAVSGWLEMWHHFGKHSKVINGEKREFNSRELCTGRGCADCAAKLPKVFGDRFYYDFSAPAWHDSINSVYERVERICKDGGYLYPLNYVCGECKKELFDMTQACPSCNKDDQIGIDAESHTASCGHCDTEWTLLECEDKQLKALANTQVECKKCQHHGYPVINLLKVTAEGEVSEPAEDEDVYDIYDVQLTLRKVGEDKQSRVQVVKWEIQEPDPKLFDAEFQGEGEAAAGMTLRHQEPIDLDAVHAPDVPAVQARMLGLDNVFSESGDASGTKVVSYPRRGAADNADDADETEEEEEVADEPEEEVVTKSAKTSRFRRNPARA